MNNPYIFSYLALFLVGISIGMLLVGAYYYLVLRNSKRTSSHLILQAKQQALDIQRSAEFTIEQKIIDQQKQLERLRHLDRKKLQKEEERLKLKEDKLEARLHFAESKASEVEKREAILIAKKSLLDEQRKQLADEQSLLVSKLENISGLSITEAKKLLLDNLNQDIRIESANLIRKLTKEAEENAEKIAASIIATAINRLAVPSSSEMSIATVSIPNEEMKGRIIGRDGRNIRALEKETGVNFIIDDTPNAIVISAFDPIRKHIAKVALTELIQDGRIHPTRIEEATQKAALTTQKQIKQYGEDAALRAGIIDLHPELIILLGKLKFRFSYGQNVLDHSLEVSHLMGLMASEMGLDVPLAKRIGLLHDIGKAVSHEIEGSHAIIGSDLALKYNESKNVANGIGCHHQEMVPLTIEASICSAADAISASREGARDEAVEQYIKRLKKLEEIAYQYPGVEKAYAIQAGREIRVTVLPEEVDDADMTLLARDIAKQIELELRYPGKIKVTLIREKRVIKYAV